MAVMLLAQISIAQHNSVHFTDHGHYEHNHKDNGDHHKKNVSEACQICLLVKSLSSGLTPTHAEIPTPALSVNHALKRHDQITNNTQTGFYNPRAPPSFLI